MSEDDISSPEDRVNCGPGSDPNSMARVKFSDGASFAIKCSPTYWRGLGESRFVTFGSGRGKPNVAFKPSPKDGKESYAIPGLCQKTGNPRHDTQTKHMEFDLDSSTVDIGLTCGSDGTATVTYEGSSQSKPTGTKTQSPPKRSGPNSGP